jgi:16S rRNA pseudouridine516 synthase
LEEGIDIGDTKDDGTPNLTLPAKIIRREKDEEGRPVIHLIIHEGRFHQVKRMLEAVGNKVEFLKRITFGPLVLDEGLTPSEYRPLNEKELRKLGL